MATMKAVQFDRFGELDVLNVDDVKRPAALSGSVVIEVRAAGINHGESIIRAG